MVKALTLDTTLSVYPHRQILSRSQMSKAQYAHCLLGKRAMVALAKIEMKVLRLRH